MYFKWHMHLYDSNLWTYHKEITNYDWKMYMKEKIQLKKIAKMTVIALPNYEILWINAFSFMAMYDCMFSNTMNRNFLFHSKHFSVVICDFLMKSS